MSDSTAEPVDATREDPALLAAGVQRVCVQLSNAGAKHPLRMRVYKKNAIHTPQVHVGIPTGDPKPARGRHTTRNRIYNAVC